MNLRLGINGFGRIGRSFFRQLIAKEIKDYVNKYNIS